MSPSASTFGAFGAMGGLIVSTLPKLLEVSLTTDLHLRFLSCV